MQWEWRYTRYVPRDAQCARVLILTLQVLTGKLPFGRISGSEVVFKVVGGGRPSKPEDALKLGLSDDVWELLEDCWKTDHTSRPSVEGVLARVKAAASACGVLSPVGGVPQRYEDPDSGFAKFGRSLPLLQRNVEVIIFYRSFVHPALW